MAYKLESSYNSLDRIGKWDPETQKIIKKRLAGETGGLLVYKFLTEREGEILEFLVNTLISQGKDENYVHPVESREASPAKPEFNRVKISEAIDHELEKDIKGVRYGKNPWPREFYQRGLAEVERFAKDEFGKPIEDFSESQLSSLAEKIFGLARDDFSHRFLQRVLGDATAIYFSHPASWNEIGFPGPAYPEGYPFLDCGKKEDWEPEYINSKKQAPKIK